MSEQEPRVYVLLEEFETPKPVEQPVNSKKLSIDGILGIFGIHRKPKPDPRPFDWMNDGTYRPLHDRGGAICTYHYGSSGPIGLLTRIEMNYQNGRPLTEGLPDDWQERMHGAKSNV